MIKANYKTVHSNSHPIFLIWNPKRKHPSRELIMRYRRKATSSTTTTWLIELQLSIVTSLLWALSLLTFPNLLAASNGVARRSPPPRRRGRSQASLFLWPSLRVTRGTWEGSRGTKVTSVLVLLIDSALLLLASSAAGCLRAGKVAGRHERISRWPPPRHIIAWVWRR